MLKKNKSQGNPFSILDNDGLQNQIFQDLKESVSTRQEFLIKKRKIMHCVNLGRGANHPSFFIRRFFAHLKDPKYRQIYKDNQIFNNVLNKMEEIKNKKNRYLVDDLDYFFGKAGNPEESYYNSKMFFQLISDMSIELVFNESKCAEILNHMVSLEKYSARLGDPELTGRVVYK